MINKKVVYFSIFCVIIWLKRPPHDVVSLKSVKLIFHTASANCSVIYLFANFSYVELAGINKFQ